MWRVNDGIDICGTNAVVDKCFVYTGDDNFCTKALDANYPLHDIHFRNSIGYGNAGGVKAGMQVRSAQSDIHFENIDILHAGRGLVVESHGEAKETKAASPMQNIFFTDIRVEQVSGIGGTSRNPIQIDSELPNAISNIFFKGVSIANFGPKPSLIGGYDAKYPVTNVFFENLTIGGRRIDSLSAGDFQTKNASGIKFLLSSSQPVK
jgi:polygalacturonase